MPGHEIIGVVEQVGKAVTDIKKGDRVSVHALLLMRWTSCSGGYMHWQTLPDDPGCQSVCVQQALEWHCRAAVPDIWAQAIQLLSCLPPTMQHPA